MMRYYAVTCKHGHHGAGRYEPITFAIIAENALSACDTARAMPGVKHNSNIIRCSEISEKAYYVMRRQSAYQRGWFK